MRINGKLSDEIQILPTGKTNGVLKQVRRVFKLNFLLAL